MGLNKAKQLYNSMKGVQVAQGAKKKASVRKKVTKSSARRKKTTSKSRKVSIKKLSAKELAYYKDLLMIKMHEILGDVDQMEADALRKTRGESSGDLSSMPIHMADIGTDNFEQEFALGLLDSERKLLKEIMDALERIDSGEYGICEGTGKLINKARLEAKPWARYSIEYARMVEKGLIVEGEKYVQEEEDEGVDSELDDEYLEEDEENESEDKKEFDIDYFVSDDDLEPNIDDEL